MASHVLALKVTAQSTLWIEDGCTIQTQVQGRVLQQWKGQLDAELSLTLPGGRIGSECVWQEDVPALSVGQSYALFLREDAQGIWRKRS